MSHSVPLLIELDEEVHAALLRRATKEQTGAGDIIEALLRRALIAEMEEATGMPPLAALIQGVVRQTDRTREMAAPR